MENTFKSNDFYTCAVCIACGAKLIDLEKTPHDFVNFVLNITPPKAQKIISMHWNRELKVPTRDLVEAINELKTRLHSSF